MRRAPLKTVLVLDGNERSALAAVRSLGQTGLRVVVGESTKKALAGQSRFADGHFLYPSPYERPEQFVDAIVEMVHRHSIDRVLPMTEVSQELLMDASERVGSSRLPMGPKESFKTLNNKSALMGLAQKVGLQIPPTQVITKGDDLDKVKDAVDSLGGFPIIVKPFRSRIPNGNGYLNGAVSCVPNLGELEKRMVEDPAIRDYPFLLQQRIVGYGAGVFVLAREGKILATFGHRRIREKPPSGGVSVLSESVPIDPEVRWAAERLVLESGWNGPAMVEFKVDGKGNPYLMEVNARFWGTLQLSVDAGVDFPSILLQSDTSGFSVNEHAYRVGTRNRWILGDLDSLYLTIRDGKKNIDKIAAGVAFLAAFFDPKVKSDVFRWNDPGPAIYEISRYIRQLSFGA